jgi:hypothetical protein
MAEVAIRPGDVYPEGCAACHALQDSIHEARVAEVDKTGPGGSSGFNRAIAMRTLLLGVFLSRFSTFYRQQSRTLTNREAVRETPHGRGGYPARMLCVFCNGGWDLDLSVHQDCSLCDRAGVSFPASLSLSAREIKTKAHKIKVKVLCEGFEAGNGSVPCFKTSLANVLKLNSQRESERFQENELCGLFSENESKRARSNKGLKAKAREIKAKVLCEVSE